VTSSVPFGPLIAALVVIAILACAALWYMVTRFGDDDDGGDGHA